MNLAFVQSSMLCLLLAVVALVASPALALENEQIRGTIVTASEGVVVFVDEAGSNRILTTTPDCMVMIDGRQAAIDSLKSGMIAVLIVNRNMQCMHIEASSSEVGRSYEHSSTRHYIR